MPSKKFSFCCIQKLDILMEFTECNRPDRPTQCRKACNVEKYAFEDAFEDAFEGNRQG